MMRQSKLGKPPVDVDGPSVVTALHRLDRELTTTAGGPKAWRRLTPLQAAFEKGQLQGGDRRYSPEQRLEAGLLYARKWDQAQTSGKNILDLDRANGSSATGFGPTLKQIEADNWLAAIDKTLGMRNHMIARMVLGEGRWPSEAIFIACRTDSYVKATVPRFNEFLDALIEAISAIQKR